MILEVKRSAFLFFVTLFFLFIPGSCFASNIKVELLWKFPEAGWVEVEIRQATYQLHYDDTNLLLHEGDSIKIGQSGLTQFIFYDNQLVIIEKPALTLFSQGNGIFRVRQPGKDWVSYRGDLTISKEGIFWRLINTLEQEDYLKGVVPIEMSNAWAAKGFEALKAQAVAARTYMLVNMDSNGMITDSPNIHQAYWGRTVEGEASQAVEATAGEVLVDANTKKPISVFYSSHNGGYSEAAQNVWQNDDPHYSSFPDPFSNGIGGIVDHWKFIIAADILGDAIGLAPIRQIQLDKYPSGRVYRVRLLDWLGKEKTLSGGEFVKLFYPNGRDITADAFLGRLFQVQYILPVHNKSEQRLLQIGALSDNGIPATEMLGPLLSRVKSSNEGLADQPGRYGVFVFNGRGWGHGVGMSQWGAYHMAKLGYSYKEILDYYYKNSMLVNRG